MKTGQTFDLVEIIGDTPGYGASLGIGQQCLSEPSPYGTLRNIHYAMFNYGHHPNPIVLYPHELKRIGKFTVTKVK